MIKSASPGPHRGRAGITLTEILIAILILGIGLTSVATLFPLGLLRLRDAARYSRSAYLMESATSDLASRSLLLNTSFLNADFYNNFAGFGLWYTTTASGLFNPLIQDTPAYNTDWATDKAGPGAYAGLGGLGTPTTSVAFASGTAGPPVVPNSQYPQLPGPGLPFAYDPLWRYQTINPNKLQANGPSPVPPGGYYPFDTTTEFEARFGSGIGFIRNDLDKNTASVWGLQRITNFNRPYYVDRSGNTQPLMPASLFVPSIFVSGEDIVWQEPTNQNLNVAVAVAKGIQPQVGASPSPVVPDLTQFQTLNDYHFSWMFTGQLSNASNQACFDGNIVIFENRPFGIASVSGLGGTTTAQVDGEMVVEAIFGHSGNLNTGGYATGADRTVLLRWDTTFPDPVVKAGDWIADVTYERSQAVVQSRWWGAPPLTPVNIIPVGISNPSNPDPIGVGKWDNLPAQRCYWYQVQKVLPADVDNYLGTGSYRSMVVYVNQTLVSRTALSAAGVPLVINAALIAPSVVNVIPQTIFVR